MKVAVRVRPLSDYEEENGSKCCIHVNTQNNLIFVGHEKTFRFDVAFEFFTDQKDVYEQSVSHLVEKLLSGQNAGIITYGSSGSGKTYTLGTDYNSKTENYKRGIIPRILEDIFINTSSTNDKENPAVSISFIEFHEKGRKNLLNLQRNSLVPIQQKDAVKDIENQKVKVCNVEQALHYLEMGCKARRAKLSIANENSSSTHVMFSIYVEKRQQDGSNCTSKMHLVDLATSDESQNPNTWIDALKASTKGENLLMIACISSAHTDMEKTVTALRFATYAMQGQVQQPANHIIKEKVPDNPFRQQLDQLPPTPACLRQHARQCNMPLQNSSICHKEEKENSIFLTPCAELNQTRTKINSPIFKVPAVPGSFITVRSKSIQKSPAAKRNLDAKETSERSFQYVQSPDACDGRGFRPDSSFYVNNSSVLMSPLMNKMRNILEESMVEKLAKFETRIVKRLAEKKTKNKPPQSKVLNTANQRKILEKINTKKSEWIITRKSDATLQEVIDHRSSPKAKRPLKERRRSVRLQQKMSLLGIGEPVLKKNEVNLKSLSNNARASEKGRRESMQRSVKKNLQQQHAARILHILNNGDAKKLKLLPCIGVKSAQIIITWRCLRGPFDTIGDLKSVTGLTPSFYKRFLVSNMLEE